MIKELLVKFYLNDLNKSIKKLNFEPNLTKYDFK